MKKNNKGFSLVELIVVVAIMAVLVGVLAPLLLQYVEKSRIQKDESAIGEALNAINLTFSNEQVAEEIAAGDTIVYADAANVAVTTANTGTAYLQAELEDIVKNINFSSKRYNGKTLTLTIAITDGVPTVASQAVVCAWDDAADKLTFAGWA